ncbi:MBOAT family protein [Pseudomonas sp. WS 5146]|uniref:MBOAT family O-acyltransferase n=1 Tax=Pseudomonas sp. WS 5146 TaxID=2717494 RepID=UPI001475F9A2|nr:MBOAT family protein [Pseudomonas sp. WS 5146]NMX54596.1 MBOAT family protein [Pseudomonas sp. WS 5146]
MVFSSYLFIFLFLPAFLIAYKLVGHRFRNILILTASLYFYYLGDAKGLWILIAAIVGNFAIGYLIDRFREVEDGKQVSAMARRLLIVGLFFNLSVLGYFKYVGFITENINLISAKFGHPSVVPVVSVLLPLGISFFVFQGISYLVDVYRGTIQATKSLLIFGTFKSLFPQLIAGPIVRYRDIAAELPDRSVNPDMVVEGITRFVIGFAKKVLLADTFAVTADAIFSLPASELNFGTAWLGAASYTLQIYFDFSAYSDMAIGMGLMMGFRFPENFNYPYKSTSIRDFWRRWHITLSGWFRDYVYVPLGGNRTGAVGTYVNLLAVFILTGLWHGASWTFVAWGLWHGFFIVIERFTNMENRGIPSPLRWVYTLAVVVFGWVLFRSETFDHAFHMMALMVGLRTGPENYVLAEYMSPALGLALGVGALLSFPVYRWLRDRLSSNQQLCAGLLGLSALFVLASMKVLSGAYSPFLYFRF